MRATISGIRGIFGDDFGQEDVMLYCGRFASLAKSARCVIGRDTRKSGRAVSKAAKNALTSSGIDVYDLGVAPTPAVFREARKYGAGIVVTASHNPIDWNGLKFIVCGRGINEDELPSILDGPIKAASGVGTESKLETAYVDEAAEAIGEMNGAPRVAVDAGGGAAADFAPSLLGQLGCHVRAINCSLQECDRGPDPTSDSLASLAAASQEAEIGFAFDLDGDRVVVMRNGRKQAPDVTLGLGIAKSMDLGCKKFVLSVDSSISVEKFIKDGGGTVRRSKVGEANVIDAMIKSGAQAGGEGSSAGFVLPEFNYCRDGLLTSGLVASMLGTPRFHQILEYMEEYCQTREKVGVNANLHGAMLEKILDRMSAEFSEVTTMDGVKGVIDEDSWVLVRGSNTEDAIRISAESRGKDKCKKIVSDMKDVVRQCHEQSRRI